MTTALLVCGALGREVLDIVRGHGWAADVLGISAADHMLPARIAPDVEKRLLAIRDRYARVIVVYGDCGTRGGLDALLQKHGIPRISGPHCYEMYGGERFEQLIAEEPGTYFLTDFLVRTFKSAVIKGMGLDRYPELKGDYFRHYKRLVYLSQRINDNLLAQAEAIARYLELPLHIHITGYGGLEARLVQLMEETTGEGRHDV